MFRTALIAATAGSALLAAAAVAETTVYTQNGATVYTEKNTEEKADNARAGAVAGATAGAIVGGPVGAVVGAAIGATGGNAATPDREVVTYVQTNPVAPVIIDGQVAAGYVVPETVVLTPVPETEYAYVYTDSNPIIVDAQTRQVIEVVPVN
jgi:hypothetical protein